MLITSVLFVWSNPGYFKFGGSIEETQWSN